ncbi:MAG: GTPase Era [Cyclobacteriaceae bacterium]
MSTKEFKSGFISIVGKPNTGKSTLMNRLVGEKLSIITSKAQTTRHRIMGIINSDDYQIVYSDTPGIIDPAYKLQESMMSFVTSSLDDADGILLVIECGDKTMDHIQEKLKRVKVPIIILINKVDLKEDQAVVEAYIEKVKEQFNPHSILPISALHGFNTDSVLPMIEEILPVHPAYFPDGDLTDKTERFFASEIVREKIFLNYKQEIPYACEVVIIKFKETDKIIRIYADIMVERDTQRGIMIGSGGKALKMVGVEARKDMEDFFGKQVYLELYVKVDKDWRKNDKKLERFGYIN